MTKSESECELENRSEFEALDKVHEDCSLIDLEVCILLEQTEVRSGRAQKGHAIGTAEDPFEGLG